MTWDSRDLNHNKPHDLSRAPAPDTTQEQQDLALPPLNLLDPYFGMDETAGGWHLPLDAQREARAMGLLEAREVALWRRLMTRGVVEEG